MTTKIATFGLKNKNTIQFLLGFLLVVFSSTVYGQEEILQNNPRQTWESFRTSCREYDYDNVAVLLDQKKELVPQEKSEKFCAIANRLLPIDAKQLSTDPDGSKKKGGIEPIGRILGTSSENDVVQFILKRTSSGKAWFFHPHVLDSIDRWYKMLDNLWLRERLPAVLQKGGPLGLALWQWLALPTLSLLSYILAYFLVFLSRGVLGFVLRKSRYKPQKASLKKVRAAAKWLMCALLLRVGGAFLYLPQDIEQYVYPTLIGLSLWALVSLCWQLIGLLIERLRASAWMGAHLSAQTLLPLLQRMGRVLLLAVGVGFTLKLLGYSATSLIAGLGIGGLALALAAQKTMEQFFGGVVLSVDQPMRIGDTIKAGDIQGTVEYIGLRSTRIRTPERSMLTIPNGKLAEMTIETLTIRDRIRLHQVIKLDYSSTPKQIREFVADITNLLKHHPKIWANDILVSLRALGESSFEVEMACWFQTTNTAEFAVIRQEILLGILELMEKYKVSSVIPTRMMQIEPPEKK